MLENLLPLIDLQLFADEEKKELPVVTEEPEEEELEELDEGSDAEDLDEDSEGYGGEEEIIPEPKPKKDKKTAAIIREKQANKVLRDRLAELERDKEQRELDKKDEQYKQKLEEKGYTEDEIEDKVSSRRERAELQRELKSLKYGNQAEKLSAKYPAVHDRLNEFIKIVEDSKGAFTLEEVCKAKLDATSAYEIRTKAEQEALINRQKATSVKTVTGERKPAESEKFSAEDEAAYKIYASRTQGATRKAYSEILKAKRG